jgi:hypothetical protein
MTTTASAETSTWKLALFSPRQRLSLILWLVAAHSFCVGLGLILIPEAWLPYFGFTPGGERFFRVQAGVFHFVMVVLYAMGAVRCASSSDAVHIAIAAKIMAMVFLISYFLFAGAIWMVLLSGLFDGMLGLLILWAFVGCRRIVRAAGERPPE